jgi:hypothetical protein
MSKNQTNGDILALLDSYLTEPMDKSASIGDDEPNGEHDASTGSRFKENASDNKEMRPNSVDTTPEGGKSDVGGLKTKALQLGTNKDETGKNVPSAPVKAHPDPGSSHPAKTTAKEASALVEMANDILADLAILAKEAAASPTEKQAQESKPNFQQASAPANSAQVTKEAEATDLDDQQLGYLTGKYIAETLIKQAQTQQPEPEVELTKLAETEAARLYKRADVLTTYLANWLPEYIKQANDGGMPPEAMAMAAGGDPAAGGGAPPMPVDPAAAGGGMGGAPADPAAAGGAPGGAGDLPPELIQLAEALLAQGVTPEQLEQLLSQAGGQAGGGDPAAGGMPGGAPAPEAAAPPDQADAAQAAAGGEKQASAKNKQDLVKTAQAIKAALAKARTNRNK